jgi:[protein-PII] uridylyltransferase
VLSLHNLNVLTAQIFTWDDGTVVDVLEVGQIGGGEFDAHDWQSLERDLNSAINYRLDVGLQLHNKLNTYGFRPKKAIQQLEEKIIIDNDGSSRYTVIEIHAEDRLGMLYQLTQTLSDFGLDIHRAKIATEVEQLIDIFYVTLQNGDKLMDPQLTEKIRQTLSVITVQEEAMAA